MKDDMMIFLIRGVCAFMSMLLAYCVKSTSTFISCGNLVLIGIVLFCLIFVFRLYSFRFSLLFGKRVVFLIYFLLFFLCLLYMNLIRVSFSLKFFFMVFAGLGVLGHPHHLPSPGEDYSSMMADNPPDLQSIFAEGVGAAQAPVGAPAGEAGPSHSDHDETATISRNLQTETYVRRRILGLERVNSQFLPQDERGEYWREVQRVLNGAANQKEYDTLLLSEKNDILVRAKKEETLRLLRAIINHNHSDVNLGDALWYYYDEWDRTYQSPDQGKKSRIEEELEHVNTVFNDLRANGQASVYYNLILGHE